MNKSRNMVLDALLSEYGFTHEAFAEEVNRICGEITGKPGSVSDRDIRRWIAGAVRWPTTRYLQALTQIFDRQPEAMGFVPRVSPPAFRIFLPGPGPEQGGGSACAAPRLPCRDNRNDRRRRATLLRAAACRWLF
ncbi:hypothetical protein NKH77_27610 [Streptomyces sp. M19]